MTITTTVRDKEFGALIMSFDEQIADDATEEQIRWAIEEHEADCMDAVARKRGHGPEKLKCTTEMKVQIKPGPVKEYPFTLSPIRVTQADREKLRLLAERAAESESEVVRRLIREAAG